MDKESYEKFPAVITIRELSIRNSQKGFRDRSRVIVTTFSN